MSMFVKYIDDMPVGTTLQVTHPTESTWVVQMEVRLVQMRVRLVATITLTDDEYWVEYRGEERECGYHDMETALEVAIEELMR